MVSHGIASDPPSSPVVHLMSSIRVEVQLRKNTGTQGVVTTRAAQAELPIRRYP